MVNSAGKYVGAYLVGLMSLQWKHGLVLNFIIDVHENFFN